MNAGRRRIVDNSEYQDIVRRLVAMMANQDTMNDRLTTAIEHHARHLARLDTAIEGIHTTLARVETLLARIIAQSDNGTEA
jgi:hypothetical protein